MNSQTLAETRWDEWERNLASSENDDEEEELLSDADLGLLPVVHVVLDDHSRHIFDALAALARFSPHQLSDLQ